ncbi:DUF87 domain-containing protein [Candidatus Woesearchaeota archaeon]|nr:DUF87 domain-containing protein [Candidatus Woesearchaeota archaeon]
MLIKGQIISGNFQKVIARQKSGKPIEIGELLISEHGGSKILFQVSDLLYGSQISQQNLEMISGMNLEEGIDIELYEPHLRNYVIAVMKSLLAINDSKLSINKALPSFFSDVKEISENDLGFLSRPRNPLFIGKLRSGSKTLDFDISIDGEKALSHHILISGTTGRGKSVLVSNMLWSMAYSEYSSALVLDPHDEYYGRSKLGLKDHPGKKVAYYTSRNVPIGCNTLKINLDVLRPMHFDGVVDFSDAQKQALNLYYKFFGSRWIESIILEKRAEGVLFKDETLAVVKRRLLYLLDLEFANNQLHCKGAFQLSSGFNTISDICKQLEDGRLVIVDTSSFSGSVELLIGSLIAHEIFNRYKHYKIAGSLPDKPIVSIVLEEAPRVLGREILESGPNILIPREILANINTKIILGTEMKPERQAIIESASQDLSDDDRTIASLDVGEALLTSNFVKFVMPLKIPFFEEFAKTSLEHKDTPINEFPELGQ